MIASRERSGNNLTGIENPLNALIPKRLEMLTRILPDARKILAYYSEDISVSVRSVEIFVQACQTLGLETQLIKLQTIEELGPLVEKLQPGDADVIFQLPSASIRNARPRRARPRRPSGGDPDLKRSDSEHPGDSRVTQPQQPRYRQTGRSIGGQSIIWRFVWGYSHRVARRD